ncbi:helix-turn-helix domain-containing protein [Sedimentitalea sp. JM2-8]|uniref:Helix-turn-helix domain-containing protein n=1 Tax=Sedimentitalea xiamensis TaxID=3050037 RepID=A0ABT7FFY1_9RHOB|nr:AraC family transcriptional regulator [Sedimentitalea xiamensis]MDK3074003.1 helix-turn-helix domain-containing protein [Sedimentitalea xiamensis]
MAFSRSIPLIRAAATAPIRRWLSEQGIDPHPLFERSGLAWVPDDSPLLPVPLRGAVRLLVEAARASGPDAPFRIARDRGVFEIGPIGAMGLAGPTVRAGLHNIARNMPRHCTHEIFTVEDCDGFVRVGDGWAANIGDPEARHLVQQYVAALVEGVCRAAGGTTQCISRVVMTPHPVAALNHLHPWLGESIHPAEGGRLELDIPDETADRVMPDHSGAMTGAPADEPWDTIGAGETLAENIGTLVASMLPFAFPSIDSVASAAGVSARTLRRRLKEEGTTLSEVIDRTRAELAIARLSGGTAQSLQGLAQELGYAHQAALTRAVKRWTGRTPRHFKTGSLH